MRGSGLGPRGTVHAMGLAASSSMSSMWALLLLASSAAAAAAAAAAALACAVDGEMGVGVEWLAASLRQQTYQREVQVKTAERRTALTYIVAKAMTFVMNS